MGNNNFVLKEFIEFMWKKYNTSICFLVEEINNKNILGEYISYAEEKRERKKIIFVNLKNIDDEVTKTFVLFHEVGHFILEKSNFVQKEEYADFLGYYFLKKFYIEKTEILNSKFIKKMNLISIFLLEKNIKKELINIGKLFCYSYKKYLKGEEYL